MSLPVPWRLRYFFRSRLGVLPDFILAGCPKCGTTSLYTYLSAHPDVYPASKKEIWFFSSRAYDRGPGWYRFHFPTMLRKLVVTQVLRRPFVTGEASPDYLIHPEAMQRIRALVPRVKLIVLLRNPVERTYSYYQHERRSGREKRSFEEAIAHEEQALARSNGEVLYTTDLYDDPRQRDSYMIGSIYVNYLERLFEVFPREQVLVLKSEDLFEDAQGVCASICRFLGISEARLPTREVHNPGRYERDRIPERDRLAQYFGPHNQRLYQCVGRDLGWQ